MLRAFGGLIVGCALVYGAEVSELRPAIVAAARARDGEAVRRLIASKVDVNAAQGDGATALLWAAHLDSVEIAKALLAAGANVNAANDLGATPLWVACQNMSVEMVRTLIGAGANPNLALLSGETPLMTAARAGSAEIVELLAAKGANVNAHGSRGQTALMWAVAQKHPEVVKVLLARGADVKARSEAWSLRMAVPPHGRPEYNKDVPHGNDTALLFAARVGDVESAKLLLAAGADANDCDAWGVTALVLSAHSGFGDLVELLLASGADPKKTDAGFSALHIAIMRRDAKMAAALLEKGADANEPLRTWTPTRRSSKDWHFQPALMGATPLWMAARFNEPEIMRLLKKHGASADVVHKVSYMQDRAVRKTETTPLIAAALGLGGGSAWVAAPAKQKERLALETVQTAVEVGADVNAACGDGRTALEVAKGLKYASVVEYLTSKGAH